ncbi:MAG: helix-turn-helix transcriptional regulator, partial [Bacteroidota bacterium]
ATTFWSKFSYSRKISTLRYPLHESCYNMSETPIQIQFKNRQNPRASFDLIQLEELAHRKNLQHSPFQLHLVRFYLLLIVEEGQGAHTIDFTSYPIERGSIVTIRKDQIQRFHQSKSLKGQMLLFTDDFLVSYLEQLEALKSLQLFNEVLGTPVIKLHEAEFVKVLEQIEDIQHEYFDVNDSYSQGIIRSELHILLAKLYRIKSKIHPTILDRKYLAEFVTFQNLVEEQARFSNRVNYYAQLMNVSTKTLNTISQAIVKKTAKAFIDEIATKQIKRLLINTDLSVKEIAYASGFEEPTNFYKYFKRQTQNTPEQFRAHHK